MPLGVAEKFAHGAGSVRRDVLKRSRFRSGRSNDNGVVHRAGIRERLHDLRDRRALLPDAAINANDVAALLIDDGIENDGSLAGLAVADDQLALSAADRNHAVDRLDAGLERLANRLAIEHARRYALERVALLRSDGALTVHRLAERIHHAANERFPHRHGHNRVRALDDVAFLQFLRFAEEHHADLFLFKVDRDPENVMRESKHFTGHDLLKAIDPRNAVADADDRPDFVNRNGLLVILDLLPQNLPDFVRFHIRHPCSVAEPRNPSTKTSSCTPLPTLAHSAARRARISFKRLRNEPS